MPQLDKFTFSSQVFWLVLFFSIFYFVLLRGSLPRLYKVLFFRKKLLEDYSKQINSLDKELYFIESSFQYFLLNSVKNIKNSLDPISKVLDTELTKSLEVQKKEVSSLSESFLLKNSVDQMELVKDFRVLSLINKNPFLSTSSKLRLKSKI